MGNCLQTIINLLTIALAAVVIVGLIVLAATGQQVHWPADIYLVVSFLFGITNLTDAIFMPGYAYRGAHRSKARSVLVQLIGTMMQVGLFTGLYYTWRVRPNLLYYQNVEEVARFRRDVNARL